MLAHSVIAFLDIHVRVQQTQCLVLVHGGPVWSTLLQCGGPVWSSLLPVWETVDSCPIPESCCAYLVATENAAGFVHMPGDIPTLNKSGSSYES